MPRRIRLALVVAVAVLALVAGGGIAAQRYSANALDPGTAYTQSGAASGTPTWTQFDLRNRSSVPVTLTGFTPLGVQNMTVSRVRVIATDNDDIDLGLVHEPLPARVQAAILRSRPVPGFVLPPHSHLDFAIVMRVRRIDAGQATVAAIRVDYTALGIAQSSTLRRVTCIRAPGSLACPPY